MAKEIYISTTPHETRLAIVEDEQLAEIYYERENEYTLAGSIYNGKVTRVLPGMQSSFVDIGLERDAFLYVTDFMEEQGDAADFDSGSARKPQAPREPVKEEALRQEGRSESRNEPRGERKGRDRGGRDRNRQAPAAEPTPDTQSFDEPVAPHPVEETASAEIGEEASLDGQGSRRWRGRRGRRRGRGTREGEPQTTPEQAVSATEDAPIEDDAPETFVLEGSSEEPDFAAAPAIEIDLSEENTASEASNEYARARDSRREEIRRGRNRMRGQGDSVESTPGSAQTAPVESAYGDEGTVSSSTSFVLPGESIRKYRDPAEVAKEDTAKPAASPVAEVVAPSASSIEIAGWDGGAILPGETLSRHRGRPERPHVKASQPVHTQPVSVVPEPEVAPTDFSTIAVSEENIAPSPVPEAGPIAAAAAPEETGGLTQHPAHADESAAVQPIVPEAVVAAAETEVEAPSAGEYEPAEGESASLGDAARRDLRRLEQRPEATPSEDEPVAEPAASHDPVTYDLQSPEADASVAEAEHSAEAHSREQPLLEAQPYSEHNFTTLQGSGEMLSETSPESDGTFQHVPPAQDQEHAADPVMHEGAVQSVSVAEAEFTPVPHQGETETEPDSTETIGQVHAYGDGDLHEEEVDGDEYEYDLALASAEEEEFDEYEEETLDDTADVGAMLHEMAADESVAADSAEDDDDTNDAEAGGFTVDDFGGEPEEDPTEASPNETSSQGDRRGRRDSRRPGRERRPGGGFRGGAGGDRGRGRGRPSVQTMDLPAINELLKPGQEILVQIAKEPIAKKGARITSHIALPGRFLVFMPTVNHTGVSRKISSDEERRRLKSILLSEKGEAPGGFIVRTAAEGASEEELRNDLRFLIQLWQDIKMRSESSKSPALIYHDLSLIERILRDQVTDNFSAIWVDTEGEYERVLRFLQRFQPSLVRRVKLYSKETPLFEHFGVTQEIDKALKSKVWLKSGGSIVIDQTEALVAIDINTGKYVGKTARLEDTILKTNLDAIPEIVRQIRLRDLGGIIVIDFIDMDERKNRAKVMQVLEDELKSDRAPSKVLPFNDFGLVIMTRKRVKQSLERTLCIPDPVTEGTGMIKSPITVANEIYVEMRKMHRHIEKGDVMLRVHPEVVKQLKAAGGKRLQELEEMTHKTILVKSDPALNPEQFDIH